MPVSQDLTEVIDKLLAQGLLALRQNAIMPQLVNRRYEEMAGDSGTTIDIPIPSAVTVNDVTPDYIPPSDVDGSVPTSMAISLNRWKEASFFLTDRDRLEAVSGIMPMQASEAVKAVVNEIDSYLLGKASSFYGYVDFWERDTAGTPFSDDKTTDATSARTVLSEQLAGLDPRHFVADPSTEGYALNVRAFQDMSWSGDMQVLLNGNLNRKLGFQWWMDQNVQQHTPGFIDGTATVGASEPVGEKTIAIDVDTGAGGGMALNQGDIIQFSSHTQSYVVTADATIASAGSGTMTIEPGLVMALATTDTIADLSNGGDGANSSPLRGGETADGDAYTMNFFFHRDALGLVTRPLAASSHPSSIIASNIDTVSGLALRVELTRQHRRDMFAYDVLYGGDVIRREFGGRFLGN